MPLSSEGANGMKADDESMCCAGDVFDKKLLGHTRYVVSASSVDARRHSYRQRRTRFDSSASVFTQHATNYGSSEPLTWPSMQRTSLASPGPIKTICRLQLDKTRLVARPSVPANELAANKLVHRINGAGFHLQRSLASYRGASSWKRMTSDA